MPASLSRSQCVSASVNSGNTSHTRNKQYYWYPAPLLFWCCSMYPVTIRCIYVELNMFVLSITYGPFQLHRCYKHWSFVHPLHSWVLLRKKYQIWYIYILCIFSTGATPMYHIRGDHIQTVMTSSKMARGPLASDKQSFVASTVTINLQRMISCTVPAYVSSQNLPKSRRNIV